MRVFIGLTEIAGYYKDLKNGFTDLGIECSFVNFDNNAFQYGGDDQISVVPWMKKMITKIRTASLKQQKVKRTLLITVMKFLKIYFFIWCICRFDVFIFGYGRSFFGYNFKQFEFIDLPILKFFKKKIIFTFNGSDSRPPYLDGAIMLESKGVTIEQCISMTAQKKKALGKIDRYADYIVDYPAQGLLHNRPFINGLIVGVPRKFNLGTVTIDKLDKEEKRIRIVHAPSNPEAKGTAHIQQAIENLKVKGYSIEFIEIKGMPNSVVLENLVNCDFVVDQLYSDTPMPGFASEAAWFGKPVILAGYAQKIVTDLPPETVPPTYYCRPEEIEHAIEKLILDDNYRLDLGSKAQQFVKNDWLAKNVAGRFVQIIRNDFPQEWVIDPKNIRHFFGGSLPENRVKKIIRDVVSIGGVQALMLHDKPEAEVAILRFADIDDLSSF
jgi:glycosyltransferase involved in cell wall biosynthesis